MLFKAAAVAPKLPTSPQGSHWPAPGTLWSVECVATLVVVAWVSGPRRTCGARGGMFVPQGSKCRVDLYKSKAMMLKGMLGSLRSQNFHFEGSLYVKSFE